ncbi:D-isomer specific 2-hydroxyacid dehydrogenase [Aspergillus pseudonomiae]|uniref:D-isomer specific 2-hydroxyacid dehydrogenase n=1 Tax=Aspergillus pseudonomiae TaxID=1506151 RepID=A0A5N6I8B0_9EURO|nr:D-isomer specific 2-hydroxyacid dehydrogenase [Aspergillus pseudonomiae]KAB8261363.1 D-isomer specific 2-hydroxyacid dehydrogenase [Aspergillus pseudonomiae]KAE8410100.1 D-isomer specific 2-hydroxyacid dehydrogenase [Aspergillus pseudonomiae]
MPVMPAPRPFILFFNPVRHAIPFYQQLQDVARTEVITSKSRDEFYFDLQRKYKDISIIYRTSASGAVAGNFDADLIQHLPPSCKHICHNGAGYDQIDVTACAKRGITVTYAPDPVTEATADLSIWLVLGALRQLNPSLNSLAGWEAKVLGILGMGRIGRAIQKRAEPFGLITKYHNRKPPSSDQAAGAEYVSFEKLLAESDIISINVPLNAQTKGLLGEKEISQMKNGVVIVNTARGAIIDEAAMAKALDSGKINERALMVPHLGTHTVETLAKMETWAMENARRAALGKRLFSPIPEHIALQ